MVWDTLPPRTLEKRELQALVDDLGRHPELWGPLVAFSDDDRHYESLYRGEFLDVWLLCWTRRNDTGWHDHDMSSGAVRVVRGAIRESNPRIGGQHLLTEIPAGHSICFGPEHIHRMTGAAEQSVSIHAYSPPLSRMGQYWMDESGLMRRVPRTYEEELRPRPASVLTV